MSDNVKAADLADDFSHLQGYCTQYRQPELFQSFTIDNGNLVWGDDWAVIYPTGGSV